MIFVKLMSVAIALCSVTMNVSVAIDRWKDEVYGAFVIHLILAVVAAVCAIILALKPY